MRDQTKKRVVIPCEVCGFDKITHSHHIIKRQDFGSDNPANLVQLCPNHHEMSDSTVYEGEMKKLIFEKTGKVGELLQPEQIKAIEDKIAEKCGGYEYKDFYHWHFTKMWLISSGEFYRIAKSFLNDKQNGKGTIGEHSKITK